VYEFGVGSWNEEAVGAVGGERRQWDVGLLVRV